MHMDSVMDLIDFRSSEIDAGLFKEQSYHDECYSPFLRHQKPLQNEPSAPLKRHFGFRGRQ